MNNRRPSSLKNISNEPLGVRLNVILGFMSVSQRAEVFAPPLAQARGVRRFRVSTGHAHAAVPRRNSPYKRRLLHFREELRVLLAALAVVFPRLLEIRDVLEMIGHVVGGGLVAE